MFSEELFGLPGTEPLRASGWSWEEYGVAPNREREVERKGMRGSGAMVVLGATACKMRYERWAGLGECSENAGSCQMEMLLAAYLGQERTVTCQVELFLTVMLLMATTLSLNTARS